MGTYGIGDRFIKQAEAFSSAALQPLVDLFTASTEEAIYYLI